MTTLDDMGEADDFGKDSITKYFNNTRVQICCHIEERYIKGEVENHLESDLFFI